MGNKKYTIITFFALAIFLIGVAFFTLSITYAYKPESEVLWNIDLGEISYKNDTKYEITTNKEYINFKVSLIDYGDEYGFMIPVINSGNIDAYLKEIRHTPLDEVVGVGASGKTYYIHDYVGYTITYGKQNDANKVNIGNLLQVNDLLKANTQNYIMLNVKFSNKERLSEEAIEVLDKSNYKIEKDGNLLNGFNLDLDVSLNYQELK